MVVATLMASAVAAAAVNAQATATEHGTVRVRALSASGPISGAMVHAGPVGAVSDTAGTATLDLASGARTIVVARLGFEPDSVRLDVRSGMDTLIAVQLHERAATESAVVVTSTRTERRLSEEPLRVEVLSGDDVTEKNEMRPGDLKTLFTEMSGVRVQNTSPSLGSAAIRVQALPGRYTLVLNDGLPLYGTHASGFGLVQPPPLDLRQAEVIKGAASALYGPTALGGVVDLISRRPPDSSQVLVNGTSLGGADVLGFAARSFSPTLGATLLVGVHGQRAADPDGDLWTDVAGYHRGELRPRLFYDDGAGRSLMVTAGAFDETRGGGATRSLDGAPLRSLQDSLRTQHGDVGAVGRWRLSDAWSLGLRAAANAQVRQRLFAGALEHERQRTLFGELSATGVSPRNVLVAGLVWQREGYTNRDVRGADETLTTPGVFVQHTFTPVSWLASTLNGRCDASNAFGTICTPRASLLVHAGAVVSVRASVGAGWFAPMALDDETEAIGLSRVRIPAPLQAEHARTSSLDVTATRGPLQVNGTLFADDVRRPVGLRPVAGDSTGRVDLVNAPGTMATWGGELFAVYNAEPIVATAYYAATRTREPSPETGLPREVPLTPREAAGLDVALEDDESGAYVAAEVFYTGVQSLDQDPYRTLSRPYTTVGLLGAKRFGRTTAFVDLENLTDVRQTAFEPLVRPTPGEGGRWTVPAWAPLEGRAINLGVRYRY